MKTSIVSKLEGERCQKSNSVLSSITVNRRVFTWMLLHEFKCLLSIEVQTIKISILCIMSIKGQSNIQERWVHLFNHKHSFQIYTFRQCSFECIEYFRDEPSGCLCWNGNLFLRFHKCTVKLSHFFFKLLQEQIIFLSGRVVLWTLPHLLLNYMLVSAWPTFNFQSMKVTLCDSSAARQRAMTNWFIHPQSNVNFNSPMSISPPFELYQLIHNIGWEPLISTHPFTRVHDLALLIMFEIRLTNVSQYRHMQANRAAALWGLLIAVPWVLLFL